MDLWKCDVCGYVCEAIQAPAVCIKCGVGSEHFQKLNEVQSQLLYDSERTNDQHIKIIALAAELIEAAKIGIEENLDPGCKKVFEIVIKDAWEIKQLAKEELAGHQKKGKF